MYMEQKNGTILCWNAQFFKKMRAKCAEISNFAQIFVKIAREASRNFKFKFLFFKKEGHSV